MEVANGYASKIRTDVEYAKRNVDPARPKEGPTGADAGAKVEGRPADRSPAVTFGGDIAPPPAPKEVEASRPASFEPGSRLNIRA